MRDAYRWPLLHISRGDRSIDDYMRDFLRLSYHAANVIEDKRRAVVLYMTGLGLTYVAIHT